MDGSPRETQHTPVMLETAIELLDCRPGGIYVDGTVGGGGYARAILERSAPDGVVLGMDWDEEAIRRVREKLSGEYGNRLKLEKADFADIRRVLSRHDLHYADGIVVDLGVSSFQLEDPARGFSFTHEGPLDMRMNRDLPYTAADLVNSLPEKDLADLIFRYGEERMSRRIAARIAEARKRAAHQRHEGISRRLFEKPFPGHGIPFAYIRRPGLSRRCGSPSITNSNPSSAFCRKHWMP